MPNIDVSKVSEMLSYPMPKDINIYSNYYIFNEFTAIPYMLLSSKTNENKAESSIYYIIQY